MAAIDKTYLQSIEQFKIIKERRKKFYLLRPNCNRTYDTYKWYKKFFREVENATPVLRNTSLEFDYFLLKNCPFDFIQNRLKEQYGGRPLKNLYKHQITPSQIRHHKNMWVKYYFQRKWFNIWNKIKHDLFPVRYEYDQNNFIYEDSINKSWIKKYNKYFYLKK